MIEPMPITWPDFIARLTEGYGKLAKLAQELEVSTFTVQRWRKGTHQPDRRSAHRLRERARAMGYEVYPDGGGVDESSASIQS